MKNQKGMAVPIALLLSVMFLMFAVMVMTVQKSTTKFTKKLNVELKAHYLALGGIQHTLLKIKELREYFYDSLKWAYHVNDSGNFIVHESGIAAAEEDKYIHPITRVEVKSNSRAADFAEALKYLDYFKCDIFSYTYYGGSIETNNVQGVAPLFPVTPTGDNITVNDASTAVGDTVLSYLKTGGGPGWVSAKRFGDPFDGEYHMSNLVNSATDPIKPSYGASGDGIAELIADQTKIQDNKAETLKDSWIRGTSGKSSLDDTVSEEGLIRFSTRIIQTGDPGTTADDTEEDSIQIIIIGQEKPSSTSFCERTWSHGTGGTQVVKLKKIEKIERRIGT